MSFTAAISSVLSKYATFTGRARRSEYWWFYLFSVLITIVTTIVDVPLNAMLGHHLNVVSNLVSLALFLPGLAVGVRRLHDTGRTGWWVLLPIVPILAAVLSGFGLAVAAIGEAFAGTSGSSPADAFAGLLIVLIFGFILLALAGTVTLVVFQCLDSTPGPNRYGPSPKYPVPPTFPGGYPPGPYGPPYPYPGPGYPPQV